MVIVRPTRCWCLQVLVGSTTDQPRVSVSILNLARMDITRDAGRHPPVNKSTTDDQIVKKTTARGSVQDTLVNSLQPG